MAIKKKADELARKFQTRNPFEIIRGLNVILLFVPLIDTRAFYQYFKRNNIIYIDENLPRHEQMFECAHEMGHMFLHKKANAIFMDTRTGFNTSRFEKEADTFAIDLLVGDDILAEYQSYDIEQFSRLLGYEQRLINLRLNSH
ncbi:ImmA/IrrE family metallo-endopeptidase [Otoolea muris]|uniref:ImmA/IrrE family metallo-endopeptidase n=1 Tax=Otoolea muris TaxID=2941515 RepID=UPI0013647BF0|nr:ImmA/IrrE family metallo-endopeptidase [Otoolea muris]NBI72372.1 ImmA/IrrE family metallo-endopeptidase [Clostridiaceae bacterium]